MIRLIILILFYFTGGLPHGQPDIDYGHKRLFKVLEREWGMANPSLIELAIPDSVMGNDPVLGKFFTVPEKGNPNQTRYIYVGRVNSCRAGGCSISFDTESFGDSEYFDYFILFGPDLSVQQVRVFNYQATHGQEVAAKGWLKQFEGYSGTGPLEVGKEIDAISGATISVYGITADVAAKTGLIQRMAENKKR
jgi:hypothetical protein